MWRAGGNQLHAIGKAGKIPPQNKVFIHWTVVLENGGIRGFSDNPLDRKLVVEYFRKLLCRGRRRSPLHHVGNRLCGHVVYKLLRGPLRDGLIADKEVVAPMPPHRGENADVWK